MQPAGIQEIYSIYPKSLLGACFSNKIPAKLNQSFKKNVKPLEESRTDERDYRLASLMGRGTGRIKDIVDPNLNCLENSWIATEFEYKNNKFQINGEINNINRKQNPAIYSDIELIFNEMAPFLFQVRDLQKYLKILNKLNVIVKIQSYQVRQGETYEGQFHQEGFKREGIFLIGIYYYSISEKIKGGNLELKYVKEKKFDENQGCLVYNMETKKLDVKEGDIAVFLNRRCEHRIDRLEVTDGKPGVFYERKILTFFIADPLKSCIPSSKHLKVNLEVAGAEIDLIYAKRDDFKRSRFVSNSNEVDYSENEGENKQIKEVFDLWGAEPAKFSPSQGGNMTLFIKSLDGQTYEVYCTSDTTVEKLKEIIQSKAHVTPDEQRLIFAGRQLSDHLTLADLNVQHQSTIHMVRRLRGD